MCNKNQLNKGFTLIELIVVVAIMVVLSAAMVINLNKQRSLRDLKIAQNQLVSNLRKIESYTLSSRALPNGQNAQYYLIKFDLSKPNQYVIQALYNVSSSPQYLVDVETINLPKNIKIATSNPLVITRAKSPTTQNPSSCALVAFATPFAKTYLNDGCAMGGTVGNPTIVGSNPSSDDYKKIINFVKNNDCVSNTPPTCSVSVDSKITITLTNSDGTLSRTVSVNGITGAVTFN